MNDLTSQSLQVLKPFLANVSQSKPGIEVIRSSGLAPGVAYPVMLRLERQGLLASEWGGGDPRRRYYRITDSGAALARGAITA